MPSCVQEHGPVHIGLAFAHIRPVLAERQPAAAAISIQQRFEGVNRTTTSCAMGVI